MDKIKAFFSNKITQIVTWCLLAVCIVILFIGGVTQEAVSSYVVLVFTGISAVCAIIAFISSRIKKKE